VLLERGQPLSLADKVRTAAAAGALGCIIFDDAKERCGGGGEQGSSSSSPASFSQSCVQGSDKSHSGLASGFAASDAKALWEGARIPALLITRSDGLKLLKMLEA
jgi:hypothetical protein